MDKLEFAAIGKRALVQSAKLMQAGLDRPKTGDGIDLHAPSYEDPPCIWIVGKKTHAWVDPWPNFSLESARRDQRPMPFEKKYYYCQDI